jgi:hypothetical protein
MILNAVKFWRSLGLFSLRFCEIKENWVRRTRISTRDVKEIYCRRPDQHPLTTCRACILIKDPALSTLDPNEKLKRLVREIKESSMRTCKLSLELTLESY